MFKKNHHRKKISERVKIICVLTEKLQKFILLAEKKLKKREVVSKEFKEIIISADFSL